MELERVECGSTVMYGVLGCGFWLHTLVGRAHPAKVCKAHGHKADIATLPGVAEAESDSLPQRELNNQEEPPTDTPEPALAIPRRMSHLVCIIPWYDSWVGILPGLGLNIPVQAPAVAIIL